MILSNDYPESRIVQIESREDTARRERDMHAHIAAGGDWDEDGRPIFHGPEEDDDMYADDDLDIDFEEDWHEEIPYTINADSVRER